MSPDQFIRAAIDAGASDGIQALDPDQQLVFLISEAEVLCDMEGIDSFLKRYGPEWLVKSASAFAAVGATEIASGLAAIAHDGTADGPLLHRTNELITRRAGYDYEAIRKAVEARLTSRDI